MPEKKSKESLGVFYVNELESKPVTACMSRPLTTTEENTAEQTMTNAVCIKWSQASLWTSPCLCLYIVFWSFKVKNANLFDKFHSVFF